MGENKILEEIHETVIRMDERFKRYEKVENLARDADNRSKNNEANIKEIKDKLTFLGRKITGAIISATLSVITGVIMLVITLAFT